MQVRTAEGGPEAASCEKEDVCRWKDYIVEVENLAMRRDLEANAKVERVSGTQESWERVEEDGERLQEGGEGLHEREVGLNEDGERLSEDGERLWALGEGSNEEGETVDGDGWREDLGAAEAK